MNRQFNKTSTLVIALMALTGNAYAATGACPPTNALTQAFKKTATGEVIVYAATGPGGQQWTGENPMTEQSELHQVEFEKALIQSNKGPSSVACHYLDQNHEPVRMTLKTQVNTKPVGSAWAENECKATNPALCTFE
ncbi:DUF3757 domain-containing protein [Pseudomonas sp. K2I15]|uniref:DUF3757 domain-containing protein n=1 Tax=unclassified Pseudomonas TaxID=196821 RepID=UPI000B4D55A1|nr:DUF3757 domain-containing protein [Pseudomonas sp. K2I15]OWP69506.1 hypothetical protein CEC48_22445 [Pseudomonas sp. K2I15]